MKVKCPKCEAVYKMDDSKIPDKGAYARCPKCQDRFFVRKEDGFQETPSDTERMTCPHCQQERKAGDIECPKCGIVYEKYERVKETDRIEEIQEKSKETEDTKKCPFCGEDILISAIKCKHCGEFIDGRVAPKLKADRLSGWWIAVIWLSLLFPFFGAFTIIILSSILYHSWKKDYPNKAKTMNRHAWIVFLLNVFFWYGVEVFF